MSESVKITGNMPLLLEASRAAGCRVEQTTLHDYRTHTNLYLDDRLVGQITPHLGGYGQSTMELDTGYLGMSGVVLIATALVGKPGYGR